MSRGKHFSLEEARQTDQIGQFCKKHPSEGDESRFANLLAAMSRKRPADRPSDQEHSAY